VLLFARDLVAVPNIYIAVSKRRL